MEKLKKERDRQAAAERAKRHCKQIRTGKLPVRENEHGKLTAAENEEEEGTRARAGGGREGDRLSGIADRGTE